MAVERSIRIVAVETSKNKQFERLSYNIWDGLLFFIKVLYNESQRKIMIYRGDYVVENKQILLNNISKVHTTEMGVDRIITVHIEE